MWGGCKSIHWIEHVWWHATNMARHITTYVWCAIYCILRADFQMGADRCVCFLNACYIHSSNILSSFETIFSFESRWATCRTPEKNTTIEHIPWFSEFKKKLVCKNEKQQILTVLPNNYQLANTNSNGRHFKPQRWASKQSSTRARPLSGAASLFLCWVFLCVSLLAPLYVKMDVSFQFVCTFVYQCIILE